MLKGQAREDSKPNRNPKTRIYWAGSGQQKTSQQDRQASHGGRLDHDWSTNAKMQEPAEGG